MEVVELLQLIASRLDDINNNLVVVNSKLDRICEGGYTITDVCNKLDIMDTDVCSKLDIMDIDLQNMGSDLSLRGAGPYNTISDVCDKLDSLKGAGLYTTISNVCDKLDRLKEDLKGAGLYTTISDVCDKLEDLKGAGLYNTISDVCDKLDRLDR